MCGYENESAHLWKMGTLILIFQDIQLLISDTFFLTDDDTRIPTWSIFQTRCLLGQQIQIG